jgi:DNA polymerase sigma
MPWGLKFDISVADTSSNGMRAAAYIREQLDLWPPLKPLVTILKLFLLQRNMNEVYTGGLGSFALILSVVAFLKMHTSRLPRPGTVPCFPTHQRTINLGDPLVMWAAALKWLVQELTSQ